MSLPASERVDVSVLAGLFANTTNSYKYLLFLALLDELERRYSSQEPADERIGLRDLAVGMLLNAWYPHVFFKLSFGVQDQISKILEQLSTDVKFSFDRAGREKLRQHLQARCGEEHIGTLLRYVVHRLQRGFFAADLRGCKDAVVDRMLQSLARERFETTRPFYCAEPQGSEVIVHRDWVAYLRENLGIVRGWASWEWVRYMQSRNQHVPAIPDKLFAPRQRASLREQNLFWTRVLQTGPVHCIYSGVVLSPESIALDHFIPWSFVAHDGLWNLVPANPSANSSKRDGVPDQSYLASFHALQTHGLLVARPLFGESEWQKATEAYVADLRLPSELLWAQPLDRDRLSSSLWSAFSSTMPALMSLATQLASSQG